MFALSCLKGVVRDVFPIEFSFGGLGSKSETTNLLRPVIFPHLRARNASHGARSRYTGDRWQRMRTLAAQPRPRAPLLRLSHH
jgi:hypothetical protein